MTAKQTPDKIETLRAALPAWTFERYGNQGAIACYPPTAPNMFHFQDLNKVAFISSVCGLLYVVTNLRPRDAFEAMEFNHNNTPDRDQAGAASMEDACGING